MSNIGKLFTGQKGFFYVFCMVPAMLIGFNVIPQSAEEMNIAERDIGKMILVGITLSVLWYCLLLVGVALAAPMEIRASNNVPLADVAIYLFNGEVFSLLVIIGGIFGILTTWNGFFIGATRLLYAMSRAGLLPAVLGKIHRKYKTPYAAVLLAGRDSHGHTAPGDECAGMVHQHQFPLFALFIHFRRSILHRLEEKRTGAQQTIQRQRGYRAGNHHSAGSVLLFPAVSQGQFQPYHHSA